MAGAMVDAVGDEKAQALELEMLAAGVRNRLPILEGWRFEQFGKDALELVEGKLAFAVVAGKLKMTHIDDMAGHMGASAAAEQPLP